MIKTTTKKKAGIIRNLEPATIKPDTLAVIKKMLAPDVARDLSHIESFNHSISDYRQRIHESMRLIQSITSDKKVRLERVNSFDWTESEQKATEQLEQTAKLAFIESIEARGDNVVINTKPFFVEIRASRTNEETTRTCTGAYAIKVNMAQHSVTVKNRLFPQARHPHWSINSRGNPCWGDWESDVIGAMDDGNLVELMRVMQPYLLSTEDGSAYIGSHEWKTDRNRTLSNYRYRSGCYVMATEAIYITEDFNEHGNQRTDLFVNEGDKGEVLRCEGSRLLVKWGHRVLSEYDSDGGETFRTLDEAYVSKGPVTHLTRKQFEDVAINSVASLPTLNIDDVDKLPAGASYKEARDLLTKKIVI